MSTHRIQVTVNGVAHETEVPARLTGSLRLAFHALLAAALGWLTFTTGRPWWLFYLALWVVPLGTSFAFYMLLRQTVQLEPRSFFGQLALGIALTKALEIPAAEQALEAAIELEPKNFYAHFRLGEMYQRIGVPKNAKEEFQIALDLADTAEQKKVARDMISAEERREPRRAWRPDFAGLLKSRRKE